MGSGWCAFRSFLVCISLCLAQALASTSSSEYLTPGFRPPSVPLVVIDPYIRYTKIISFLSAKIYVCRLMGMYWLHIWKRKREGESPKSCLHTLIISLRPLQYDSLFPLSPESLGHAGGRFIIHYSLSLCLLERQQYRRPMPKLLLDNEIGAAILIHYNE